MQENIPLAITNEELVKLTRDPSFRGHLAEYSNAQRARREFPDASSEIEARVRTHIGGKRVTAEDVAKERNKDIPKAPSTNPTPMGKKDADIAQIVPYQGNAGKEPSVRPDTKLLTDQAKAMQEQEGRQAPQEKPKFMQSAMTAPQGMFHKDAMQQAELMSESEAMKEAMQLSLNETPQSRGMQASSSTSGMQASSPTSEPHYTKKRPRPLNISEPSIDAKRPKVDTTAMAAKKAAVESAAGYEREETLSELESLPDIEDVLGDGDDTQAK